MHCQRGLRLPFLDYHEDVGAQRCLQPDRGRRVHHPHVLKTTRLGAHASLDPAELSKKLLASVGSQTDLGKNVNHETV